LTTISRHSSRVTSLQRKVINARSQNTLDRDVVEEFLDCKLTDFEIPKDIDKETLVEAFCQYTEDDYYEWLKDNFKSFFNHGDPDWDWIRQKISLLRTSQK
jgi:hypothetical protein